MISPVLEEAKKITDGDFPDHQFTAMFPLVDTERALRSEVEVAVNERDPKDAARRTVLLEYWGDAPDHLVNLERTIHATFQVPLLALDEKPYTPSMGDGKRDDEKDHKTSRSKVSASVAIALADIENWAAGRHPLSQNTAGTIRGIVAQAVFNRCQWNDPLTAEADADLKKSAWPAKSIVVSIDGAEAENLAGTKDAPIKFARSAENSVFFKGLIEANAGLEGAQAANKAMRQLAGIAERYEPALQAEVLRVRHATDENLVAWFTASLLGAALCGRAWPEMADEELVAAVFDDGSGLGTQGRGLPARVVAEVLSGSIARPVRKLVHELRKLVGIQRGTGGAPRMIDAARVLLLVRQAAKAWRWQAPPGQMPKKLKAAVAGSGLAQIPGLAHVHVAGLREINVTLATLLPDGTTGSETLDAVEKAFEQALGVGLGPTTITDPAEFRKRLNALREADWRSVSRLRKDLEAVDAAADESARQLAELKAAAVDRGADLPAIVDFLKVCDEWFTARLDEPSRGTSVGDAAAAKVQDLIVQWRKVVGAA